MSPRRQKYILKRGYDSWDPFQEPKDPIDIRKDKTKRTTKILSVNFCRPGPVSSEQRLQPGSAGNCAGIVNSEDRFRGMYEFACWYRDLLLREGHE